MEVTAHFWWFSHVIVAVRVFVFDCELWGLEDRFRISQMRENHHKELNTVRAMTEEEEEEAHVMWRLQHKSIDFPWNVGPFCWLLFTFQHLILSLDHRSTQHKVTQGLRAECWRARRMCDGQTLSFWTTSGSNHHPSLPYNLIWLMESLNYSAPNITVHMYSFALTFNVGRRE